MLKSFYLLFFGLAMSLVQRLKISVPVTTKQLKQLPPLVGLLWRALILQRVHGLEVRAIIAAMAQQAILF